MSLLDVIAGCTRRRLKADTLRFMLKKSMALFADTVCGVKAIQFRRQKWQKVQREDRAEKVRHLTSKKKFG